MRATVTQLNASRLDSEWLELVSHTRDSGSELVVLPEMPFHVWLAASRDVEQTAWFEAVASHATWLERLAELGAAVVVGTKPIIDGGRRFNEAFVWTNGVVTPWHRKTYLPDEPGFWEATWYERGPVSFETKSSTFGPLGIQICTEMWFFEHARDYAMAGVRMLLTPRATEHRTVSKWIAGGRSAAVTAGAYSLSSNHTGSHSDVTMGGVGWIISPDGDVLGRTKDDEPFVTMDLDLGAADAAKATYPRYVATTPT